MKTPSNAGKKYTNRLKNTKTIAEREKIGAVLQAEFDKQKELNSLSKNDLTRLMNIRTTTTITTIFKGEKGYEITSFLALADALGFNIKLEKRNG